MQTKETVFEKTYKNYLEQLRSISFESISQKLGVKIKGNTIKIPLYKSDYEVSFEKITSASGEKPTHDICVILSKYILLCPDKPPKNNDWVSFRNFKDSGPLITYFKNDVECTIASYFSEKLDDLKKASNLLGGYPPVLDVKYDFSIQFDALPMIPVIMLYNDRDEEFPAQCSVLFESRAEKYLDAECIAMLGRQLFSRLKISSN
ncbi:MAG: DUF3786 domain-containing protein [Desulfobacterales bacterium]|nr:DUF3786 domain-containing protein [Desulfobacterales bacterium]